MGLIPTLGVARMKWDTITRMDPGRSALGYCFSLGSFIVGWGYWADWDGFWGILWWIVNGSLAAAYVGAVHEYDGDEG